MLQLPADLAAMGVEKGHGQTPARPLTLHARRALESAGGTAAAGLLVGAALWLAAWLGVPFLWWLLAAAGTLIFGFAHVAYPLAPGRRGRPPGRAGVVARADEGGAGAGRAPVAEGPLV